MQGLKCARPLALAFLAAMSVGGAQAQKKYIVNDLGVLSGGIVNVPVRVNANGWVTGTTTRIQSESAFVHNGTSLLDLGSLPGYTRANAVDMNRFNRIIGTAGMGPDARAFVWNNNSIQELSPNTFTGPTGRRPSEAGAINDAGLTIANDMELLLPRAFFGAAVLSVTDLTIPYYVTGANNRNRAIGHSFDGVEQTLWTWVLPIAPNTAEQFQEVNVLRQDDTFAIGNDITDLNVFPPNPPPDHLIVGTVSHPISTQFPDQGQDMLGFATPVDGSTRYLTPLPGDNISDAYGVNRSNVVVGRSGRLSVVNGQSTTSWRACVWVPAPAPVYFVAVEGQQLLPVNTDIIADNFTSINDQGQTTGTYTRNGTIRCFRLDPILTPLRIDLTTTSIAGGLNTTGRVFLDDVAPTGGAAVSLSTNNGIVQVPPTVTVGSNSNNVQFTLQTSPVTASTPVLIIADRFGYKATNTLRVQPPTLMTIQAVPNRITGGFSAIARITILGRAPANGYNVTLGSSDTNTAYMSAGIKVPAGASTVDATVITKTVQTSKDVTLSATADGVTRTAVLNVSTPFLDKVTVSPNSVLGGTFVLGTATLTANSMAGGSRVLLKSSAPSLATVPAQVIVPAGQRSATFPVNTFGTVTTANVTITGNFNASTRVAQLLVRGAELRHLILNPTTVMGGVDQSKGSVGLDAAAPAGGATVSLSSTDAGAAPPATVTIPAGATYRQFWINTSIVESTRPVTVLATYLTVTKTATLTVQGSDLIVHNVPSPVQPPMGGNYPIFVNCSVLLNRPAQAGGARVFFDTSDNQTAIPPVGILIPPGQTFGAYQLEVLRAQDNPPTTITATRGLISIERELISLAP